MSPVHPVVGTIAVIGAGRVGRGIAQVAALGGYRTILEDLLPNALRRAESEIRDSLDQAVDSSRVSIEAARIAFSRLEFAGSIEEAARLADLVIEAVPEELESKIEMFTLLDKICRPGTILASTTTTRTTPPQAGSSPSPTSGDFPRYLPRQKLSGDAIRRARGPGEAPGSNSGPGD